MEICLPSLCRHVESEGACNMSAHGSHPCVGTNLPAHLLPLLDNCTVCGIDPILHLLSSPTFPPRSKSVWCALPTDQRDTPLLQRTLHHRNRESSSALQQLAVHKCLCEISSGGSNETVDRRILYSGRPRRIRNLCSLQVRGSAASFRLTGAISSGDKHVVSTVVRDSAAEPVVPASGGESKSTSLIVRMHWPKGMRKGTWHWPRPVPCHVDPSKRLVCSHRLAEDEFWQRCRARLKVSTFDEAYENRMWGAGGANMIPQHAMRDVRGWPTLMGAGCCAYRVDDSSVVPVPLEVRRAFTPGVTWLRAAHGRRRWAQPSHSVAKLPPLLACKGFSAAQCALFVALRSIEFLHTLTERHHLLLLEHVVRSENASEASTCGELDLRNSQFCVTGLADVSGSADERSADDDLFLVLCDTDFIGPRLHPNFSLRPLSYSTAVTSRSAFKGAFPDLGGQPTAGGIIDLPCALANTFLRPLAGFVPAFQALSDELIARHEAIVNGDQATVQLSFSCMHAWLRAAVPTGELAAWAGG